MARILLLLTGVMLVGVAGFALLWFQPGRGLQAPTATVLLQLRDGRLQELLEDAHPALRARWRAEDLAAWWAWWTQRKGRFFEIVNRTGYLEEEVEGRTRKILLVELGFQREKVPGRFEFLDDGRGPQLAHLAIVDPALGQGSVEEAGVAQALGATLLQRFDARDWLGLHGLLSAELQRRITPWWLQRELAPLRARLGARRGEVACTWETDATRVAHGVQDCTATYETDDLFVRNLHVRLSYRHERGRWQVVDLGFGSDG